MNRAFSVPHSKHAQPSCPAPYTRLTPVPSDQAFPTLQQLLILPPSSQLSVHSGSPFIRTILLSVRIVHDFFVPYESLSVRIVHGFFRSVRIVIRTNRRPFHSVRIVHDLAILDESSSVRIVSLSVRFVIRTNRYPYESLSDCTCLPLLLCLVFSFGVVPCY